MAKPSVNTCVRRSPPRLRASASGCRCRLAHALCAPPACRPGTLHGLTVDAVYSQGHLRHDQHVAPAVPGENCGATWRWTLRAPGPVRRCGYLSNSATTSRGFQSAAVGAQALDDAPSASFDRSFRCCPPCTGRNTFTALRPVVRTGRGTPRDRGRRHRVHVELREQLFGRAQRSARCRPPPVPTGTAARGLTTRRVRPAISAGIRSRRVDSTTSPGTSSASGTPSGASLGVQGAPNNRRVIAGRRRVGVHAQLMAVFCTMAFSASAARFERNS